MLVFACFNGQRRHLRNVNEGCTCGELFFKAKRCEIENSCFITCNGKIVNRNSAVKEHHVYHIHTRLLGGKGGFGSMLRTLGAQIEKTTNREAMRDLSGRRMRDINNEKKLQEWVASAADRERDKEERKRERMERRKAELEVKNHKFVDRKYMEQKDIVASNLDDAVTQGLKRGASEVSGPSKPKKSKGKQPAVASWYGVNMDELSSSENSSDDGDSVTRDVKPQAEEATTSNVRSTKSPTPQEAQDDEKQTDLADQSHVLNEDSSNVETDLADQSHVLNENPSNVETLEHKIPTELQTKDIQNTVESNSTAKSQTTDHSTEHTSSPEKVQNDEATTPNELPEKTTPTHTEQLAVELSNKEEIMQNVAKDSSPVVEIDLEKHTSAEELEEYGLESLKLALMSRKLKCGGSLQERAQRLFSVKGLKPNEIDPTLLAKSRGKQKAKQK